MPEEVRRSCDFLIIGKLWEGNRAFWNKIQEKIQQIEQVKYLGLLPHQKILEVVASSDVVVCCSRDDPFPLVTLEASMLCKIMILNDNVGSASIFKKSEACLMFDVNNAAALAKQMLYAYKNQEEITKMGVLSRSVYERELTIEKFSNRFFEIIDHA